MRHLAFLDGAFIGGREETLLLQSVGGLAREDGRGCQPLRGLVGRRQDADVGCDNEQTVQICPSVQLSIASAGNQAIGLPLASSKTS